jgi:uncharacterized protein
MPTLREKINRMLDLLKAEAMNEAVRTGVIKYLYEETKDVISNPEQLVAAYDKWFEENYNVRTREFAVKLWEKYFTEAEIDQIVAFYDGPLGQKIVNVQQPIINEMIAYSQQLQPWMGKAIDKLIKQFTDKSKKPASESAGFKLKLAE